MRLPIGKLELAKLKSPGLRDVFARYADCLLAQIFQSTACNAIHSIEQRTAKWIISAMDRTGSDVVPLTHEQLAGMLGVGRSYASRVIQTFKVEGILETRRGAIVVRNRAALDARSCQCNEFRENALRGGAARRLSDRGGGRRLTEVDLATIFSTERRRKSLFFSDSRLYMRRNKRCVPGPLGRACFLAHSIYRRALSRRRSSADT